MQVTIEIIQMYSKRPGRLSKKFEQDSSITISLYDREKKIAVQIIDFLPKTFRSEDFYFDLGRLCNLF